MYTRRAHTTTMTATATASLARGSPETRWVNFYLTALTERSLSFDYAGSGEAFFLPASVQRRSKGGLTSSVDHKFI